MIFKQKFLNRHTTRAFAAAQTVGSLTHSIGHAAHKSARQEA